jgi:hypothetical protein
VQVYASDVTACVHFTRWTGSNASKEPALHVYVLFWNPPALTVKVLQCLRVFRARDPTLIPFIIPLRCGFAA